MKAAKWPGSVANVANGNSTAQHYGGGRNNQCHAHHRALGSVWQKYALVMSAGARFARLACDARPREMRVSGIAGGEIARGAFKALMRWRRIIIKHESQEICIYRNRSCPSWLSNAS